MKEKDEEDITPILSGSGGYPLLQSLANEIADALDNVQSFDALRVRRKLRAITAIMASWGPMNQPTVNDRKAVVDELIQGVKEGTALIPAVSSPDKPQR